MGAHRHRLAAILAADAAGYSRLMAIDEEATVAALDAARKVFREQIEAQQGRVIDMAGDSVLAVFGTVAGAVTAALAIQVQVNALADADAEDRRMRFRIGVHLGDVIEKADGSVYGDGVNIAARLQGLAEPGGSTVSESIRSAVKGKVAASFEDQGEQAGLADAPGLPQLHSTLAMNLVGSGDIAQGKAACAEASRLAPAFVERLLAGRSVQRKPEYHRRLTTFLRIAAGLEDPSAADALR